MAAAPLVRGPRRGKVSVHDRMNPTRTPDRREVERLEKLREQLSGDMEALRQKEASLREYEQRLRLLIEHAHGAPGTPAPAVTQQHRFSNSPASGPAELDAAWEKYHRAQALLEAARRGLSDDRLALRDREQQVARREQEVARREAWLKGREQEIAQAVPPPRPRASFTAAVGSLLTGRSG